MRIGIVVGSTRPGRRAETVARWVHEVAVAHVRTARFEILDLAEFDLPLLDEPAAPATGRYRHDHSLRWAHAVAGYDGYVFVTPEYNRSTSAALKNAIDYLFAEWHDKAAGFVSYGVSGGWRAADALRMVLAEVKVASVRTGVGLSLHNDFTAGRVTPATHQVPTLQRMLDEVLSWSSALERERR